MIGILSHCSGSTTPFGWCRAFPRAQGSGPVGPPGQPSACEPAPELCQTHITGDPQEDVGWELLRNCHTLYRKASVITEACQRSSGCSPHSVPWYKCDPKRGSPVSGVGSFVTCDLCDSSHLSGLLIWAVWGQVEIPLTEWVCCDPFEGAQTRQGDGSWLRPVQVQVFSGEGQLCSRRV